VEGERHYWSNYMTKDKWIWMPHAGHFIGSRDCRFHLNTYVGGYIVSTVGDYWPRESLRKIHAKTHDPLWLAEYRHLLGDSFDNEYFKRFGYKEVGYGRLYETMVFKAQKQTDGREWDCCPYQMVSAEDVDFEGYNDAVSATKGHMKLCKKWSKK
jgi:hypothetical protein